MTTEHAHYFTIEIANGPRSKGICQKCGEVKSFKNFVEGDSWSKPNQLAIEKKVRTSDSPW